MLDVARFCGDVPEHLAGRREGYRGTAAVRGGVSLVVVGGGNNDDGFVVVLLVLLHAVFVVIMRFWSAVMAVCVCVVLVVLLWCVLAG